jgi:hypothetical protein
MTMTACKQAGHERHHDGLAREELHDDDPLK